jgi:predicted dehydrogenase
VGAIRRITSAFAFRGQGSFVETNIRADGALEPLGCLGDLGWYCIRLSLWAMKWRVPRVASAQLISHTGRAGSRPVPMDLSAELLFDDGVSAGFSCSFTTALQQWAIVSGTAGQLMVPDFVLPSAGAELEFDVVGTRGLGDALNPSLVMDSKRIAVAEHGECHPTAQETRMFRDFGDQIRSGTLNAFWPEISLKTQRIADACYAAATSGVA